MGAEKHLLTKRWEVLQLVEFVNNGQENFIGYFLIQPCPMASKSNEIPKHELQALARAFADDINTNYETEEGQKEYEEWLQQKKDTEKVA